MKVFSDVKWHQTLEIETETKSWVFNFNSSDSIICVDSTVSYEQYVFGF